MARTTTNKNSTAPKVEQKAEATPIPAPIPVKVDEKVWIRIPYDRKNKEPEFVSVNDKTYQIKRGVDVLVPLAVAEVVKNSEKLRLERFERLEQMVATGDMFD